VMSLMMLKVSPATPLPRTQRTRMTKKYRPRHAAPSRSGRIAGRVAIGALGAPLAMFAASGPAGAAPLLDDNGDSSVGDTAPSSFGLPDLGVGLGGLLDTAQLPGLPGQVSVSGLLSQLTGSAELPTKLNPASFDRFDVQQVQRWHQVADDADWDDEDSDSDDDDSDWDDDDEDFSASDWDDDDDDSDWDSDDSDDDDDDSSSSAAADSDDDGGSGHGGSESRGSGSRGSHNSGGSHDSGGSSDSDGSHSTNADNASSNSGGGSGGGVVGGLLSSLF